MKPRSHLSRPRRPGARNGGRVRPDRAAGERSDLVPVSAHPRFGALCAESLKAALARPIPIITAAIVTALVCVTVLLTTGRAVRAEQDVVSRLDDMGTLLIAVSDNNGAAEISSHSVTAVSSLEGVAWAFALGPAQDGHNANIPADGTGVAERPFYGDLRRLVTLEEGRWPGPGEGMASVKAAQKLGLADGVGGMSLTTGDVPIVGVFSANPNLKSLSETVLAMPEGEGKVLYLYAEAASAGAVGTVVEDIPKVLTAKAPDSVQVESPEALLRARETISSDLSSSSRQLMLGSLGLGLILVMVTMMAAVTDRKNDFGRRRALGATRSAIVVMVLAQAALAGVLGAALGVGAGMAVNQAMGSAQSTPGFMAGLAILAVASVLVASLPPALIAANRDPVRILRVP
ncbi:MAG: ABC transporter permease [Propionibacteriaceae bacterium]|jgi:putative ABC transport system permease protein|nr:ABC transporter permease [Propionibacteriaceae bacterium]